MSWAETNHARGGSILFSEMSPSPEWEDRFNRWYDTHHIPIRLERAPGFLAARRYRIQNERKYLAVYELDSPAALESSAYLDIKENPSPETKFMLSNVGGFTRYVYEELSSRPARPVAGALDAPVLYAVFVDPPDTELENFDRWYEEEHVPLLLSCDEWLLCRRFRAVSGQPAPARRLALHYLADGRALNSDARKKARATPWRHSLAVHPWFAPRYLVFDRIGPSESAMPAGIGRS